MTSPFAEWTRGVAQYEPRPADQTDDAARRAERAEYEKVCEIKIGLRAWHQAILQDLTPAGFRIKLTDSPRVGTVLKIRLPGMAMLEAEVCWCRDFQAGCKFLAPLSPYVFEHLVKH